MISIKTNSIKKIINGKEREENKEEKRIAHQDWRNCNSWKNTLINYRIMIQPIILFGAILPWLRIMKSDLLWTGFNHLLHYSNNCMTHFLSG